MPTTPDELKYSSLTRIVGQNEDNAADVSNLKELEVADVLDNGGVYTELVLTTAGTAYELKVGALVKADRKMVEFIAVDNNVYYGYSNTVTTSNGIPCFKNQHFTRGVGSNTSIWFVSSSNNAKVRISEL